MARQPPPPKATPPLPAQHSKQPPVIPSTARHPKCPLSSSQATPCHPEQQFVILSKAKNPTLGRQTPSPKATTPLPAQHSKQPPVTPSNSLSF